MKERIVRRAFSQLNSVLEINTISFEERLSREEENGITVSISYTVALVVFHGETNFTVTVYDFEDEDQTYAQLIKKAVEKLKQIANEKTR